MYVLSITLNTLNDINTVYLILKNNGFDVSKEEFEKDLKEEILSNRFQYTNKIGNTIEIEMTLDFRWMYLTSK